MTETQLKEVLNIVEDGYLIIDSSNEKRIANIITNYMSDFKIEDEEGISKYYFRNEASGMYGKVDGNLFRIFTRFNPFLKEIEIILLDPNHLIAIRNEYLEKHYLENRNNTISIEQIILDNESLYK